MQTQVPELQLPRDSRANAVQRKDPMVRIKVKSRSENQLIPGGYLLPRSEVTCLVYEPDLPVIQAMVEDDPAAIAQAEMFFMKSIESSIGDELASLTEDAKAARLIQARQEYSGSVEAKFKDLFKRDIRPIEKLEVMERNIAAPAQQQVVDQQTFLASTIAKEVATALASALPGVMAAMLKEFNAQKSSK